MELTKTQEKTIKLLNDSNPNADLRNRIYDFIFLSLNNSPVVLEEDWSKSPFQKWFQLFFPICRKFGINCWEYKIPGGKRILCDYDKWKITHDRREYNFNDLRLEECRSCKLHINFDPNFRRIRKEWKGISVYYSGELIYIVQNMNKGTVIETCRNYTKEVKKWNPERSYGDQEWKIVKNFRGFEII